MCKKNLHNAYNPNFHIKNKMNFTDLQVDLLFKLWRNRCFGKGHMLIDNLVGGFPSNIKGQMQVELDELIKKNVVIKKKHDLFTI